MHEQDEATQTQNILRCRRHCQAHMQHLHTQKETVVTIRSHANQFSADARGATGRDSVGQNTKRST